MNRQIITVIGRGHSGTRAISRTLNESGVYMGATLNPFGDLVPPDRMYEACRVIARHVQWKGGVEWDFERLATVDVDPTFRDLVVGYLDSILKHEGAATGWKLPETTLAFPWIARMFPNIKYIFWIRNPMDCVLAPHVTDNLRNFGIDYPATRNLRLRRAISWKYQFDVVKAVTKPLHWLEIRFEDFVLHQTKTLALLEEFLGMRLACIPVACDAVNRWRRDSGEHYFDFLAPAMREYGYDIPGCERPDHPSLSQ